MSIKRWFSTLTILYLKLFQYEKYLDQTVISPIFDHVNLQINELLALYDSDLGLRNMSLDEICENAMIEVCFSHTQDLARMHVELIKELGTIHMFMISA